MFLNSVSQAIWLSALRALGAMAMLPESTFSAHKCYVGGVWVTLLGAEMKATIEAFDHHPTSCWVTRGSCELP